MTQKIEMTKTEAAAAGKLNSEKFNELKALREMYPGFQIVVKAAAKKADRFKGLTYDYMKDYIEKHPMNVEVEDENGVQQTKSVMEIFRELCGLDENGKKQKFAATASYGEVKMWFLNQYPEIEAMGENVNKIVEAARKARAAKKAA